MHTLSSGMAGRGRGRGGRGPAVIPFTDEETGKRVTLDVDAPPALFPVLASACRLNPLTERHCVAACTALHDKHFKTSSELSTAQCKARQTGH